MGSTDNFAVDKIVENVLEEGEQVLWYERPRFFVISRDQARPILSRVILILWLFVMTTLINLITNFNLTDSYIFFGFFFGVHTIVELILWPIVKKNNWFVVTDKRIIRIINFPTFRIAQRKLSELKHYNYALNKNGKGDVFFGPYEVTMIGNLLEYDYGYTIGNANYHVWKHYDKYLDMTLHFFSVEHIDEFIEILEERTSAVKFEKK